MYDFDCYAEDNKFVYEYKYLETVGDEALPQIKKAFDEKFEEMKSTVKPLMEQLVGNVKEENPIVVLRFCNSDGSVISEKNMIKPFLMNLYPKIKSCNITNKFYNNFNHHLLGVVIIFVWSLNGLFEFWNKVNN